MKINFSSLPDARKGCVTCWELLSGLRMLVPQIWLSGAN